MSTSCSLCRRLSENSISRKRKQRPFIHCSLLHCYRSVIGLDKSFSEIITPYSPYIHHIRQIPETNGKIIYHNLKLPALNTAIKVHIQRYYHLENYPVCFLKAT